MEIIFFLIGILAAAAILVPLSIYVTRHNMSR